MEKTNRFTPEEVRAINNIMLNAVDGANTNYIINKKKGGMEEATKTLKQVSNDLLLVKEILEVRGMSAKVEVIV